MQADAALDKYGDGVVEKCTSVFGSIGGKFCGLMKGGCDAMISGCKYILPTCKDQSKSLSAEVAKRDLPVGMSDGCPAKPTKPTVSKPPQAYLDHRCAQEGYTH